MDFTKERLGKIIENLRLKQKPKMSIKRLSDLLMVNPTSVYRWEAGQSWPEIDKLIKMSEIFDVDIRVLLDMPISDGGPRASKQIEWILSFLTALGNATASQRERAIAALQEPDAPLYRQHRGGKKR